MSTRHLERAREPDRRTEQASSTAAPRWVQLRRGGTIDDYAVGLGASPAALQRLDRALLQFRAAAREATARDPHQVAASGASGSGSLPHLQRIQQAFGPHDVGGVKATVGGSAADACQSLGAEAYAYGDRVAFSSSPSLHTAAHEAAHVVQQRHGVQLKGGVGQAGDRYEQHADAVADAVVAGRSAVQLLDSFAGGGSGRAVQRQDVPLDETGPSQEEMDENTLMHHVHKLRELGVKVVVQENPHPTNPFTVYYLEPEGGGRFAYSPEELLAEAPKIIGRMEGGVAFVDAREGSGKLVPTLDKGDGAAWRFDFQLPPATQQIYIPGIGLIELETSFNATIRLKANGGDNLTMRKDDIEAKVKSEFGAMSMRVNPGEGTLSLNMGLMHPLGLAQRMTVGAQGWSVAWTINPSGLKKDIPLPGSHTVGGALWGQVKMSQKWTDCQAPAFSAALASAGYGASAMNGIEEWIVRQDPDEVCKWILIGTAATITGIALVELAAPVALVLLSEEAVVGGGTVLAGAAAAQ